MPIHRLSHTGAWT